ncbi:MAG: serine protease [Planctomycetaceae bacterium]|nr:serine protease [Planctomycetaceae bacterium]
MRAALSFLVLIIATSASAGPMTRNLETVYPRMGQRGTTVEVRLQGVSLDDPQQIIFYEPGIKAIDIKLAPPPPRRGLIHGAWIDSEVRCRFVISPDCPPGEHVFRLRTATELTNLGTFHVSPFQVLDEAETKQHSNDSRADAKPVDFNVSVRGVLESWPKGDRDTYRVQGKAGQRLSVEVDSTRISNNHYGDSEYDVAARIMDSDGRVIGQDDDNSIHIQDPLLSVKLPADGDYFIEVRRSVFTARKTDYCVHIGGFKRPRAVFPPGGQAGTKQRFKFIGDPLGDYSADVQLPSTSISRHVNHFGGGPSSLRIRTSPYPNVVEDKTADVTPVAQIPVALNGVIDSPSDFDAYRLTVKKGEPLRVRVLSAAMGSPIDVALRIRPVNEDGSMGEPEINKDDTPVTAQGIFGTGFRGGGGLLEAIDPSVVWSPKVDGEYVLDVIDTSGLGGPTAVYRVEIEPLRTAVQTYLRSRTNDWTESMRVSGIVVPQGNRWTINLSLEKGQANWPKTDFDLIAHGLPKGVRLVTPRVPKGTTYWPIQFEADANAKPAASTIRLEAKPVGSDETVETFSQQCVPFINHSGGDAWRTVRTDRYVAAVTKSAPFTIEVAEPQIPLVRGGELRVPVQIKRHNGYKGPVELVVGFAPRSVNTPPPLIIPPDESTGVLQLAARSNAPLETSPFVVLGNNVRDDAMPNYLGPGHVRVSSKILNLRIAEPFVEFASQPASIRRGERKAFVWNVKQNVPFEGSATVKLLGLPKGVRAVAPHIEFSKESKTVAFELEATDLALLGQVTGLICEVSIPINNQTVIQRTGNGKLRIDPSVAAKGGK